ncbi:MAG: transglutaminaseTgpA domain-containing protein [Candidatus Rokuibacteriota bacterium]
MTLARPVALAVAVYVLVADGLAALVLGGLLTGPWLPLVALAVAGSWWQTRLRVALGRTGALGALVVGVALAALAADLLWLAPTMLDWFTHLLVFLLLYRLYTRRTLRDVRDVAFLAFFMLVAVSPITFSVGFFFLLVVFLVVGIWLLVLRHLLAEGASARSVAPPRALGLGGELVRVCLLACLGTMAITAALFFVMPRVGQATLPLRTPMGRMLAGFSERVELGSFGEIETDSTVVMRVHLPAAAGATPEALPLRWRGVVLDRFDGRAWSVGRGATRVTVPRQTDSPFGVHRWHGGPLVTQEIYLEPMGTDRIFGAPRMVRLTTRAGHIAVDDLGAVTVPTLSARLRYTVDSELEPANPRAVHWPDGATPSSPAWRARYTQLPPVAPRVEALARELGARGTDAWDVAQRIAGHLRSRYRYSRVLERRTALEPVEEFLFVGRSGNCEYFAASAAVLLRTLGIPARVVNGFQRGEWNPYGAYFMVRLSDAHSWVEVFVDGAGWMTLDPSPRATEQRVADTGAVLWLDAVRMRWYQYVINWGLQDQVAAALAVRRTAVSWRDLSLALPPWSDVRRAASTPAAAVVGGVVAALLWLAWLRRRPGTHGAGSRLPGFYARALRALARRGVEPGPGETARELAARASAARPAWSAPLGQLTTGYERVRFGGGALAGAELDELEACAAALERGP